MTNFIYSKAKEDFLAGNLNLSSNTITLALVDSNFYSVSDSHEDRADIPNRAIVLESNLTSKTINSGIFSADDVTFTNVTANTAEALVLYHRDTENGNTASRLILYVDTANGLPTSSGANVDINIRFSNEATKIFSL